MDGLEVRSAELVFTPFNIDHDRGGEHHFLSRSYVLRARLHPIRGNGDPEYQSAEWQLPAQQTATATTSGSMTPLNSEIVGNSFNTHRRESGGCPGRHIG